MTTPQSPDTRIGDSEREQAINALGEHYSAGRLDLDEYGERTAQVTAARTRADLQGIFTDLPQPHPALSPLPTPPPSAAAVATAPRTDAPQIQRRQLGKAVLGLSWLAAIVIVATIHAPYVIFVPIALSIIFGAMWGSGSKRDRHRERRDRHRDRHGRD